MYMGDTLLGAAILCKSVFVITSSKIIRVLNLVLVDPDTLRGDAGLQRMGSAVSEVYFFYFWPIRRNARRNARVTA
jgi:hypothetical protein